MMQLTEEQRKALAGLCRIEIKRWKAASESDPNMRYMVELMETALAGLTAEPIGRVDRGEVSDSNEYPDARVVCLHEQADWENFQDGTELFLRPAPAINLAELVPPEADGSNLPFAAEGWNACQSRQLKNFWSLAVYSGMRHGELCALAWEDIDLIKGTVTVRRNLTIQDDFTPPKTASGERTVFLVDSAVRVLKDQLELTRMRPPSVVTMLSREYGKSRKEDLTFVFNPKVTAVNNASDDYYTVASIPQTWRSAIRRAGITYRKPYQSRHTYACWSLSAGANPNFIASQMGHANAQMVYQVYGSWMKENDEAQRSLLNEKLNEFVPSMPHTKAI